MTHTCRSSMTHREQAVKDVERWYSERDIDRGYGQTQNAQLYQQIAVTQRELVLELVEAASKALNLIRDLATHPDLCDQLYDAIAKAESKGDQGRDM